MALPQNIYSVESVRAIDKTAIEDQGIPGYTLMCRAAEAALRFALVSFPAAQRWQVICGAGNNAGDGYVLARLAATRGIAVGVLSMVEPDKLAGDAATAYAEFTAAGGVACRWTGKLDADATLLVDGLLGSGLCRDVDGVFATLVSAVNEHPAPVMALDIPSGIDGDSGAELGVAVSADLTVTFVGLKTGLFLRAGPQHAGKLEYAGLDIPDTCFEPQMSRLRLIGDEQLTAALPPRRQDANKGNFGHVLVIGGGPGMPGAMTLCGAAALRAGAGKVSVATHPSHAATIAAARPELMCHEITAAADLEPLLRMASVIVIGPGLGQSDWARPLWEAVQDSSLPLVVDADALNMLSQQPCKHRNWILTPHPGEAARLLGSSSAQIQQDRFAALTALHEKYSGTIVLKGAGTLVSSNTDAPWISGSGNPGMAAPGMGDVLAGVIGALLAQGLAAEMAAAVGVEVHARAGDTAAAAGERGLLASDLLASLRPGVNP